jgi:AraC-like DNA-binding protein
MDWRIKALFQKILSVSRLGDRINHSLITFNKQYHQNVVMYQCHEALRKFEHAKLNMGLNMVALEVGTGYSLISVITLALLGFDKIITVDITCDISFKTFKKQITHFNDNQITEISKHSKFSRSELYEKVHMVNRVLSLEELFKLLNIIYIAPYNFEDIEKYAPYFDYITSQVVLEHVPPSVLDVFFKKTKQWLREGGYSVHTINFIDHFANPGLFGDKSISEFNFLKYSNKYWKFWAGNSLAYTNRLSYLFYLQLCKTYNLEVIEFIGENYRESIKLNSSLIHEDVIKKYDKPPNRGRLTEFQRGTLIIKA